MANKPINRFEVQYAFEDGYLRWRSRRAPHAPPTAEELANKLIEIAEQIRQAERVRAKDKDAV